MPFRASFDCLWCGVHHDVRGAGDLEGWASLCPECIGRADDNGFLRARLRTALTERSAAVAAPKPVTVAPTHAARPHAPGSTDATTSYDDWYLRRGRFSAGPIIDQPWQMELDEATRWLDVLPIAGTIVELAAGSGWWSTLLASKGELWMFDADEAALERARQRLVAHGLLAHLHVRDPLGPPDRQADVVFSAYLLGPAPDEQELLRRLAVVRGWLRPGGQFVFVDAAASDEPALVAVLGPRGPLIPRSLESLDAALIAAGLEPRELMRTPSAFAVGSATTPT